jgi:hypothetical protein
MKGRNGEAASWDGRLAEKGRGAAVSRKKQGVMVAEG